MSAVRRGLQRLLVASGAALALTALATGARAQDDDEDPTNPSPARLKSGFEAMTRPVGMAEGNLSVLTLPGAEVCVQRNTGCKHGDVVFGLEGWEFYRWSSHWAFGAGVMLGLLPTAYPRSPPESVPRDHTRSYFSFEGMLRYYPYIGERFEAWFGPFGGLVVVSDRFTEIVSNDDRALLGSQGVTLRTEGGSIGLAGGLARELGEHVSLLGSLRVSQWFLRFTPEKDPLGATGSLTGSNTAIMLGVGIAYRASL
ncbi:MAG TPA: hypothetical protein VMI54_16075 [Polyangiaceae bacterium]|nr:hypothetical protein [Polyangiaceae bacterium]